MAATPVASAAREAAPGGTGAGTATRTVAPATLASHGGDCQVFGRRWELATGTGPHGLLRTKLDRKRRGVEAREQCFKSRKLINSS